MFNPYVNLCAFKTFDASDETYILGRCRADGSDSPGRLRGYLHAADHPLYRMRWREGGRVRVYPEHEMQD